MRLGQLKLTRFGHFTDFSLTLPAGADSDFHIVLGANEAGKSTMVEGWLNLLYGIPARTSYAFRHERDVLEISAEIEDGGDSHQLTRLRRASNSLVGPDGSARPEAIMTGLLRGVGEEAYRQLYCLDDDTIEKGGEDILASKGDLGQLLFAAASGLAAFNETLEQVRADDRAFHIARGQGRRGTTLAALRRRLDELDTRIKEADLTAPAYRRLRDSVERAQRGEAEAKATHAALVAEDQALRAKLAALPIKSDLDGLREELSRLGPQPRLPDGTAAEMTDLSRRREAHLATLRAHCTDIAEWTAERDRLDIDPRAEGLSDALTALQPLRRRAQTAAEDLPSRHEDRDTIGREVARLLDKIGLSGTDPSVVRATGPALDRLDRAVQTDKSAQQRWSDAAREHDGAVQALARAQEGAPQDDETTNDPDELQSLLDRLGARGVAEAVTASRLAHDATSRSAADALAALTIGGHGFAAPGPVPLTPEGAEALAHEIDAHSMQIDTLDERLAEDDREVSKLAAEIAALRDEGAAPGDDEAMAIRKTRDSLWSRHRNLLTADTADAFAQAMAADDQASALRMAETTRLADLRRAERDHARILAAREARAREHARAGAALEARTARLSSVLEGIGLPTGLSATELATWLHAHAQAVAAHDQARRTRLALEDAEAAARPIAAALSAALGLALADLPRLVDQAHAAINETRAQKALVDAANRVIREAGTALGKRRDDLEMAETAIDQARDELSTALSGLNVALPDGVTPAAALPILRALAGEQGKLASLDDRIAKMTASSAEFGERIAEICAPWPELQTGPPLQQAAALDRIAEVYRRSTERKQDLDDQIAKAQAAAEIADRDRRHIEDRAAQIAEAWENFRRPEGFAAIATAVEQATVAVELRDRAATTERALIRTLGVADLLQAEAEMAAETETTLRTREQVLAPNLRQAAEARDAAIRALGLAEKALQDVSGDGDVARLAQDRRTLLEEIRFEIEQGLHRRIGLLLASRALGRYRDQHRGAMLAATEAAFIELTGGAYSGLSARQDGKGEVLIAHRSSDGRSLRADEATMSKGTRFQLYLALRLAGYRQMADAGTVLPFLCDDIFETFDEARTAAACRLMHRIGQIGQALYFTHHAHVAEIAKRECPSVQVHQL
jgi:uncharacterized protein YhaN